MKISDAIEMVALKAGDVVVARYDAIRLGVGYECDPGVQRMERELKEAKAELDRQLQKIEEVNQRKAREKAEVLLRESMERIAKLPWAGCDNPAVGLARAALAATEAKRGEE